jgi:superfamily II DNA or RNA helicase
MLTPWQNSEPPPRPCQSEALDATLSYLARGGDAGMVSMVMGSGKTRLTAETCRMLWRRGTTTLVTVPSQALVVQTADVMRARLGNDLVGTYWQHARDLRPVLICCNSSLDTLAEEPINVNTWIADEAHGTEAAGVLSFRSAVQPRRIIGLSATPWRANDRERLSIFRDLIYEYTAAQALADGVLVPWRFPDPLVATDADEAHHDLDDACTDWILRRIAAGDGPTIVDANTIEDAETYAAELVDAGIRAMAVHSKMRREAMTQRIEALRTGDLDCIVHVNILTEGVDMPWLVNGCLRRRRGSRVKHVQHIGRYMRSAPGKTHCNLFDPHGLFGLHSMNDPAALGEYSRAEKSEPEETEHYPLIDPFTGEEIDLDAPAPERRRVLAAMDASSWLLQASAALRGAKLGQAQRDDPAERKWRVLKATPAQLAMLDRWKSTAHWMTSATETQQTPELRDLARAFRAVHARKEDVRRGSVSDLITCMVCARRAPQTAVEGTPHPRDLMIATLRSHGVTWPEPSTLPPKPSKRRGDKKEKSAA